MRKPARRRARKEPRGSAGDLRAFVSSATVSVAMFDQGMRCLAASPRWRDDFCGGARNVIGRSLYDVVPDLPQHWKDLHRRALAGETLWHEDRFERRDGRSQWLRQGVRPWHGARRAIRGVLIHFEDITARVEAEQALRKETAALARLHEASSLLWETHSLKEGLDVILSATIDLLGADKGNVQIFDPGRKVLRIAAQRGFEQDFLEFFREVSVEDNTACGRALRAGGPVVIEDNELDADYAPYRSVAQAAGYRAVVSAPLLGRDNVLLGMVSAHFRSPHRPSDTDLQRLDLYARRAASFIERFGNDQALRASEERLRLALAGGRLAMFDRDIRTDMHVWSDECYPLLGYRAGEVVPSRAAWMARIHADDRDTVQEAARSAMRDRKDYVSEYRILRPDGSVRWVRARGRFLYDGEDPVRLIGLVEDITESRQYLETQQVIIAELQHRTRNLMAVVQSIALQTLSTASSLEDFKARFDQRLRVLSRVQGLLSRAGNEAITLDALVGMELAAIGSSEFRHRISSGGPSAPLRKSTVEMLSLAIHELATNAVKYGALASETGRLSVTWEIAGAGPDRRLQLDWIERGIAPPPRAADRERRGYGRRLIEQALPYSLSVETTFELVADELRCAISIPLATNEA